MTLMTGKNEYLYYDMIFRDVKLLLKDNGIKLEKIPKTFMLDFEKGLINSVKKILKM